MVDRMPLRKDIQALFLPVNKLAEEIDNPQGANMILVGAFMYHTNIIQAEKALECFDEIFEGKSQLIINKNKDAFIAGIEYANTQWPSVYEGLVS